MDFYRIRPIDKILGHYKELEKQSIYFAPPSQLNDPMEGFRNIYWSGDIIIWKNLFKHYLFCLTELASKFSIGGEKKRLSADCFQLSICESDLVPKKAELFNKIKTRFFKIKLIEVFIGQISRKTTPIRRDELNFYLKSLHLVALQTVFEIFYENKLVADSGRIKWNVIGQLEHLVNDFIGLVENSLKEKFGEVITEKLYTVSNQIFQEMSLAFKYNSEINEIPYNKLLLIADFPMMYIKRLESLVYPDWYTACFMSECENSSIWSHYGGGHSGVCLIFKAKTENEIHYINLRGINDWGNSGAIYGNIRHIFHKIDYEEDFGEIDFFRSLGTLTMSKIKQMWYYNENNEVSVCAEEISKSEQAWRNKYWKNFHRDIVKKSQDWKYENEYRLLLTDNFLNDYSDPSQRTLSYDFSILKGLIFGINITETDKIQILKIIEKKCKEENREDFKFYQAYYSLEENCIKHYDLNGLKFTS